jgi:hypothetical protein
VVFVDAGLFVMGLDSVPRMLSFLEESHRQPCELVLQDTSALDAQGRFRVREGPFGLLKTRLKRQLNFKEPFLKTLLTARGPDETRLNTHGRSRRRIVFLTVEVDT